jgi:hypothetical protein
MQWSKISELAGVKEYMAWTTTDDLNDSFYSSGPYPLLSSSCDTIY